MDRKQTSQITTGVLLIALGLMFFIDRYGLGPNWQFTRLWPVLLIVLGVGSLLAPSHEVVDVRDASGFVRVGRDGRPRRGTGGGWLVLVGALFLLNNFHIMTLHQSWPLFIVGAGVAILFGRGSRRTEKRSDMLTDEPGAGFRMTGQVLLGLVVIAFGLLLTLDNLGFVDAHHVLRYWPLIVVAIGIGKVVQADTTSSRISGGLIALVGVWISAQVFYGMRVRFWDFWPLVLVGLGVLMIARVWEDRGEANTTSERSTSGVAFWSGVNRRITSANFRRADFTAIMGGVELDLRQASTGGGEAVIDLFIVMGGIEITVPPDWSVSNQALAIMGGIDDKSTGGPGAQNRLVVRGMVLMGGVEIKT